MKAVIPRAFVALALVIAAAYGLASLFGARRLTMVISGTDPGSAGAAIGGWVYVALHFAFVVGVPVLLIGAALFAIGRRLVSRPEAP